MLNQNDMQAVADETAKVLSCNVQPRIHLKDVAAGRGNPKTGYISIPKWTNTRGETYQIYYVIHEVCHLVVGLCSDGWHGKAFKKTECKALEIWGIKIEYARAYPKALYANGERAYGKTKR